MELEKITELIQPKMCENNEEKEKFIEEHGVDEIVKKGEYGITKFFGQTLFYIPTEKFEQIGFHKIVKIIENIFKIKVKYSHHEYKHSYCFELPPVLNWEGEDDGRGKLLIKALNAEIDKQNKADK